MHKKLKEAFRTELHQGRAAFATGDLDTAFRYFERAHVLGQQYVIAHTISHYWMLRIGLRRRDGREIRGQIVRLLGSLVVSRIWVPLGNTGGANVSPFQPMPIADDLAQILRAAGKLRAAGVDGLGDIEVKSCGS